MKHKALYISITMIISGVLLMLHNAYYTEKHSYTTADGSLVLVETLGLPIGWLMVMLGLFVLLGVGVRYAINFLGQR